MSNVRCGVDYDICLFGSCLERVVIFEVTDNSLHPRVFGFQSLCFVLAANENFECREREFGINQIQYSAPNVTSSTDPEFG